jgi:hypothetical protein
MPIKELTELQRAWIALKVADPYASHAECARRAGYHGGPNNWRVSGSRNARNPKVREALGQALGKAGR